MKFKKFMAAGFILALTNTNTTIDQIITRKPKEPEFTCPIIEPLKATEIDKYEYFDHYLKQAKGYGKYLGGVVQGKFSPAQAKTIFDILKEQYKEYDYMSQNMSDLIDFRYTILSLYSNNNGFTGLNTKVAADVAASIHASSLSRLFQNSNSLRRPLSNGEESI